MDTGDTGSRGVGMIMGQVDRILQAAMALASHFRGNGGLSYKFYPPEDGVGRLAIMKNDKVIYEASDESPEITLTKLFVDIIEKEKVQKSGDRHKYCYVCRFMFPTINDMLKALAVASQLSVIVGAIAASSEQESEDGDNGDKKPDQPLLN